MLWHAFLIFAGYKIIKFGIDGIIMDIRQHDNCLISAKTAFKRSGFSLLVCIVGIILIAYNARILRLDIISLWSSAEEYLVKLQNKIYLWASQYIH